ncbi:concanavalin A-like lectin/glucanase domain-containing protein [Globomyces pollinis-pini]|nr:concanavalin A-like lectin/glucanase domain-containing protein [Globomyces pollinis-pini]KAJ2997022.1 hypothetical protein HDV02_005966 [Globomyces sp. JEL0801]
MSNCIAAWGQCGGSGFPAPLCCVPDYECKIQNQWYSQCLPADKPATTVPVISTASPVVVVTTTTSVVPTSVSDPPTNYAKNGLVSLPLYDCSSTTQPCTWVKTAAVLDTDFGNDPKNVGVTETKGGIRMVMKDPRTEPNGARLYLVSPNQNKYEPFNVKNRKLTFDVDVSQMQCGYNAALYFSEMNLGGRIGTGYCDAQGTCNEYDVLEANIAVNQMTTHSCQGAVGNCDHWGCALNTRASGLLGPSKKINTLKPFTVETAFYTNNNSDNGDITKIVQTFTQNGNTYSLPDLTEGYCVAQNTPQYATTGRIAEMSKAFERGMTMVFSIWGKGDMGWLDGGSSNPDCRSIPQQLSNSLTYSNLKLGRI